ncbi:MAG: phosphatase PAP2 family protein [Candidatus Babeliaceae bacterium]|nr:phosphatase PAP2 family protein [Candidatus Babeliaceae bacterium]
MPLITRTLYILFFATGIEVCASYQSYRSTDTVLSFFMRHVIADMAYFNRYLFFTSDTYKILALSSPLYMLGRAVDKPIHNYFYDKKKHRNIHTIAPVFEYAVDPLMGVSITTLILLQFLSGDAHTKKVSEVFFSALPFLWLYKDAIKLIPCKAALRPKNQYFFACKEYYGGFPSGHMWEAVFMAYLFAAELGINYAIPLGAFATLVAVQSVAINRHTASQVIAGAAMGIVFGVAAQKVVHRALHNTTSCGIILNKSGNITFTVEKKF